MKVRPITFFSIPDVFPIGEAYFKGIYGKIRNGKTYSAIALAFELASQGVYVKISCPVKWEGYDERDHWWFRFLHYIGLHPNFLVVPKENIEYVDILSMDMDIFFKWFQKQTDCVLIIDEAQNFFDSYIKTVMEKWKRMAIFAAGHFNRALILVTQRPMQLHPSVRTQIAMWYKVEKRQRWWFKPRFVITEFQEVDNDGVPREDRVMEMVMDEETGQKNLIETDEYKFAENQRVIKFSKKIASRYNSKYLRGTMPSSQKNHAYFIHIPWLTTVSKLFTIDRKKVEPVDLVSSRSKQS